LGLLRWNDADREYGLFLREGEPSMFVQRAADFEGRCGMKLDMANSLLYATDSLKVEEFPYFAKIKEGLRGGGAVGKL